MLVESGSTAFDCLPKYVIRMHYLVTVCERSKDLLGTFLIISFVSCVTYALPLHKLNYTAFAILLLHIRIGFSAFTTQTWSGQAIPHPF